MTAPILQPEIQAKAETLLEALPYLQRYSGKCVVIKVGGEMLDDLAASARFVQDLILLRSVGIEIVLCHGGGPQISRTMSALGIEPKFVDGLRVTDEKTIEVTAMVLIGKLNAQLTALFNKHSSSAVGLSGIDGKLFSVEQKDPALGFVGNIVEVNPSIVKNLIQSGLIAVIAPVGIGPEAQLYNINADTAASKLAVALKAEKLVLLTNVPGLYQTFGKAETLISETNSTEIRKMLNNKSISAGMIPKLTAVLTALDAGVPQAHILDGRLPHSVLLEIFTQRGVGTIITPA